MAAAVATEPLALGSGVPENRRAQARRARLWLPLFIPLAAILAVAFYTLNVSRMFLAASKGGSTPAVILAAGITLTILIGASVVAAFPQIRTSSLVLGAAAVMVIVLLGGSIVLGASEPERIAAASCPQPTKAAVNTLEVDALPTIAFQAKNFDVPAGVNQIKYIGKGGTHTLLFDGAFPGCELQVPTGKNAAKYDLATGKTYTIYCSIPGHRSLGMQATITVGAPAVKPIPGTATPVPTTIPPGSGTTLPKGGAPPTDSSSQSGTSSSGN